MSSNVRRATHSGSWYSDNSKFECFKFVFFSFFKFNFSAFYFVEKELNQQLENWLAAAGSNFHGPAKAIISP